MAALADAQHARAGHASRWPLPDAAARPATRTDAAARGRRRAARCALAATCSPQLCERHRRRREFPAGVREICASVAGSGAATSSRLRPSALLGDDAGLDAAAAPFVMAALQVYWIAPGPAALSRSNTFSRSTIPGICPVCGTLPVASIVRVDRAPGLPLPALRAVRDRMAHGARHVQPVSGDQGHHATIRSRGGSEAAPAPSPATAAGTYRKILYQEKDPDVEPVADDLASLALDLLMSEAGYHRAQRQSAAVATA